MAKKRDAWSNAEAESKTTQRNSSPPHGDLLGSRRDGGRPPPPFLPHLKRVRHPTMMQINFFWQMTRYEQARRCCARKPQGKGWKKNLTKLSAHRQGAKAGEALRLSHQCHNSALTFKLFSSTSNVSKRAGNSH